MNYLRDSLGYRTIPVLAQSVEAVLLHCEVKVAGLFVRGTRQPVASTGWQVLILVSRSAGGPTRQPSVSLFEDSTS